MTDLDQIAKDGPQDFGSGIGEPLRTPLFRRIWSASLLSNLGLLVQAVGAGWLMTQLTSAVSMVALVQTALMLPIMLVSVPAGAIADMYDKRKVGIFALSVSFAGAALLTLTTAFQWITPWSLLGFCFLIGSGSALFSPAWQSSVSEQVPSHALPQAVALNSISYNIARSFGPAIGGVIVAAAGAVAAFLSNALLYLPLLFVLLRWKREQVPSRLPPERLDRAITSGFRYVVHTPTIRVVLWRTAATGIAGGSMSALMPLVAKDLLGGSAQTYGLLLGSFGMGAIISALNISYIRQRLAGEAIIRLCAIVMAAAIAVEAMSGSVALCAVVLFAAGGAWMVSVAISNITIQLSAPRWVAGRTLAAFQATICGGIAFGSWLWGMVAQGNGVAVALLASAGTMAVTPILAIWLNMPEPSRDDKATVDLGAPDAALALTARSGPVVVEIVYRVRLEEARAFYRVMQAVQLTRHRNGAYDWTIARNIADPMLWTERFHCPTWLDYLRLRTRHTTAEIEIQRAAESFHHGTEPMSVQRMLERPFGSVRWKEDAPDTGWVEVLPITAT